MRYFLKRALRKSLVIKYDCGPTGVFRRLFSHDIVVDCKTKNLNDEVDDKVLHVPVLADQVVEQLQPSNGKVRYKK